MPQLLVLRARDCSPESIFRVDGVYTEPLQSTSLANWPLVASSVEEDVMESSGWVGGGEKDLPKTPAKENKVKLAWGYLIQDTGAGRKTYR